MLEKFFALVVRWGASLLRRAPNRPTADSATGGAGNVTHLRPSRSQGTPGNPCHIRAATIEVAGVVYGNLATDRLVIHSQGRIFGNAVYQHLQVREGGLLTAATDPSPVPVPIVTAAQCLDESRESRGSQELSPVSERELPVEVEQPTREDAASLTGDVRRSPDVEVRPRSDKEALARNAVSGNETVFYTSY